MFTILFIIYFLSLTLLYHPVFFLLYYTALYSPVYKRKGGLEKKCNDRMQRLQEILYVHSHFICCATLIRSYEILYDITASLPSSISTKIRKVS